MEKGGMTALVRRGIHGFVLGRSLFPTGNREDMLRHMYHDRLQTLSGVFHTQIDQGADAGRAQKFGTVQKTHRFPRLPRKKVCFPHPSFFFSLCVVCSFQSGS